MSNARQSIFYGQQVEEHDDATRAKRVIPVNSAETIINPATEEKQDSLAKYGLYATEYGATYNYIAKEDTGGAWFIQRETISTGVRGYVAGASDVATAWTNRASQTYGLFSATF